MLIASLICIAVFWLAWANGANDNFKGVATLYGSGATGFHQALVWASVATLAGCLVSVLIAHGLIDAFSGKGLIPDELTRKPAFLLCVGAAAAITILLATALGMPTSTTHALIGSLVGAGIVAAPGGVNWPTLGQKFAQPMLLSPLLSIAAAAVLYLVFRRTRRALGVTSDTCVCIGSQPCGAPATASEPGAALRLAEVNGPVVTVGSNTTCVERYQGSVAGVDAQQAVNWTHFVSGGSVCFARALNDTPKIAAIMLVTGLSGWWTFGIVSAAMVAGGWLHSRKVAETMSHHITTLNTGQGLTANLVTASLVLIASRLGVPVSTTHVSCGSIFGIGVANGTRQWRTIAQILATWVTTLPLALLLGAAAYAMLG